MKGRIMWLCLVVVVVLGWLSGVRQTEFGLKQRQKREERKDLIRPIRTELRWHWRITFSSKFRAQWGPSAAHEREKK